MVFRIVFPTLYVCFLLNCLEASWLSTETICKSCFVENSPQIAVDPSGNATAIWERSEDGDSYIVASVRPSGGTWQTSPDIISRKGLDAKDPQITIDRSGNSTAVWTSNSSIQASTKLFGDRWQEIPDSISSSGQDAVTPQIAVDTTGNTTVVWSRFDGRNFVIQASTRIFGENWQENPDTLSVTGEDALNPQITVDPFGNASAIWVRSDGTHRRIQASTKPFGGSWQTSPDTLSIEGYDASSPQIAGDSVGTVTAVWVQSDGANTRILSSCKSFGSAWQITPDTISQAGCNAIDPHIAVDPSGNATAVWVQTDGSNFIIQAATKLYRSSWPSEATTISPTGGLVLNPQVAVDPDGNIIAVWSKSYGSNFIIQAASKLFGSTWQPIPTSISQAKQGAFSPKIAITTSGNGTAVWRCYNSMMSYVQSSLNFFLPKITNVSPNTGSTYGGNTVTITGTNFVNASAVQFGLKSALDVKVISANSIQAIAPAGDTGTVDITVTTSEGSSQTTTHDQYTYITNS
jgi:hypothetical protein